MGNNSSANDDHDTQFGDLAQQLNDTSFFAGQNGGGDIQLPDDLNFFKKGNDDQIIDFDPKNEDANIRQIEDDMANLVDQDLILNISGDSFEKKLKQPQNEIQDSDDKEVEDLFRDSSDSVNELESFKRQLNSKTGMGQIKN